ncbi:hypothetical protein J6590_021337 [Homalodisca vitripennis]|nr:hypothetical protein J6590_021337 [Homalodisca vitripennis]
MKTLSADISSLPGTVYKLHLYDPDLGSRKQLLTFGGPWLSSEEREREREDQLITDRHTRPWWSGGRGSHEGAAGRRACWVCQFVGPLWHPAPRAVNPSPGKNIPANPVAECNKGLETAVFNRLGEHVKQRLSGSLYRFLRSGRSGAERRRESVKPVGTYKKLRASPGRAEVTRTGRPRQSTRSPGGLGQRPLERRGNKRRDSTEVLKNPAKIKIIQCHSVAGGLFVASPSPTERLGPVRIPPTMMTKPSSPSE